MHPRTELNLGAHLVKARSALSQYGSERGICNAFLKPASGDEPFRLLSLRTSPRQEEPESLPVPRRIKVMRHHESIGAQTIAAGEELTLLLRAVLPPEWKLGGG